MIIVDLRFEGRKRLLIKININENFLCLIKLLYEF